jgi:glutamate-1-semialdehyde 2,1-aminomutase
MELGSIEAEGMERVFLLSTTHGAEMCGLGAFIATVRFMQKHQVVEHMWDYGRKLISMMNRLAEKHRIDHCFKAGGIPCSPYYITLDSNGENSMQFRTLFLQEMIVKKVLMPWVALCYRHGDEELYKTELAVDHALKVYRLALDQGINKYLIGPPIKPVFRRFN